MILGSKPSISSDFPRGYPLEKPPEIGVFGGFGEKPDFGVLLIVDFWSLLLKKPVFSLLTLLNWFHSGRVFFDHFLHK